MCWLQIGHKLKEHLVLMAKTHKAPPANLALATLILVLGVIVLLAVIFGAFAWLIASKEGGVNQIQLYVFIAIFSFLTMFAMFAVFSTSTAEVWGKKSGINFRIVGPPAAFFISLFVFWEIAPGPETRTVRAIVMYQGQQLAKDFTITPTIPGQQIGSRRSENFQAMLELPSHISQIPELVLALPGYRLKSKGPFAIEDQLIRLDVVHVGSIPPALPGERPNTSIFKDLPSRSDLEDKIGIAVGTGEKHGAHELQYRNTTDESLRLLILDCSRHYLIQDKRLEGEEAWLDFPFDPSEEFKGFDHFENSTGWYCFAVMDKDRHVHALIPMACINVFKTPVTTLTVTSSNPGMYEAKWE